MEGAMSGGMSAESLSTAEIISKAMVYRRKAATCGRLALYALEPADRARLLCMQEAWTALAANEDWLDGSVIHPAAAEPRS
jgi:hypothetical protein